MACALSQSLAQWWMRKWPERKRIMPSRGLKTLIVSRPKGIPRGDFYWLELIRMPWQAKVDSAKYETIQLSVCNYWSGGEGLLCLFVTLLLFLRKSILLAHLASAGVVYVTKGLDHPKDSRRGNLTVMWRMVFLRERKRSPKGNDYEVIFASGSLELRRQE